MALRRLLGDAWTTLRTGQLPPDRRVSKVEYLHGPSELDDEYLRRFMKVHPQRWWVTYVRADGNSLSLTAWNRRHVEQQRTAEGVG